MRLKQWAKLQGIGYWTALRWFHSGKMPVRTIQTDSGSILVVGDTPLSSQVEESGGHYIYARVSGNDQKEDLQRQLQRLRDYCAAKGIAIAGEVAEVGSGLNGDRRGLSRLLNSPSGDVVVEHKDRLARFGVQYIEAALSARGRKLVVMNETESKQELVQDFIDVVTSMCARIYGKRSAANRAAKALAATKEA